MTKLDKLIRAHGTSGMVDVIKFAILRNNSNISSQLKNNITYMLDELEGALEEYFIASTKMHKNPLSAKKHKIYDTILAIEAIKGKESLWPNEKFRHAFSKKSKASVYGLADGSLHIQSQTGKKLWKTFKGYKENVDY